MYDTRNDRRELVNTRSNVLRILRDLDHPLRRVLVFMTNKSAGGDTVNINGGLWTFSQRATAIELQCMQRCF